MAVEQNLGQDKTPEKSIRLTRPSLVVLCGPAACGKSTFAARHFRPTQIISSDWARGRVCDDERDQRFQSQAFALVHFLIQQRLSLNRLCVVDSTALILQARKDLLELARKCQVPCVALLLDVPLEKCVERDQGRDRVVGRPVIERQCEQFAQVKSGIRQEGFEQVIELCDEDLDNIRIEVVFRPVTHPAPRAPRPPHGAARSTPRPAPNHAPAAREGSGISLARSPVASPRPVQPESHPAAGSSGQTPRTPSPSPSPAPAAAPTQPAPRPTSSQPDSKAASNPSGPSSSKPEGEGKA